MSRIGTEKRIVGEMIAMYCHDEHGRHDELCPECQQLLDYSRQRLDRCPFGEAKRSCQACTVHCYNAASRSAIRRVMRHSGPRMLWHHPLDALWHLWVSIKEKGRG